MSFCHPYCKNFIITLFAGIALSACGGGGGDNVLPDKDTTAPIITKTEPVAGDNKVVLNSNIVVTFNEVIQLPEFVNINLYEYKDDGSLDKINSVPFSSLEDPFSLDSTGRELTIRPLADVNNNNPLVSAKKYQINLSGIKDIANNPMASICRFEFATAGYQGQLAKNVGICDTRESSESPTTSANIKSGSYNIAQQIILDCIDNAGSKCTSIYYTLDGTTPTNSSLIFADSITISFENTPTSLLYFGVDSAGIIENVQSQTYIIDTIKPVTTTNPVGSNYRVAQTVELNCTDTGAIACLKTFYTIDDTLTEADFTEYTGSISISAPDVTTTLRYFSVDSAGNSELVKSEDYTITTKLPNTVVNPVGGIYQGTSVTVDLSCSTANPNISSCAQIFYTLNGAAQVVYSGPINISLANAVTILNYYSVDSAGNTELEKTQTYELDSLPPITTATQLSQFYNSSLVIELRCVDTSNAGCNKTYYTLDGSMPTTASLIYATAISLDAVTNTVTTLKYFSIDMAGNSEAIQTQIYTPDSSAPVTTASEVAGTFPAAILVDLTCDDGINGSGCKNTYYTTDGSVPIVGAAATSVYTGSSINISTTTMLRYYSTDNANNSENATLNSHYFVISTTAIGTSSGPYGGTVYSIAIDPRSSEDVFIGTDSGVFVTGRFPTGNGTINTPAWSSRGLLGMGFNQYIYLSVDSLNPNIQTLFVPLFDGLHKSSDEGINWKKVSSIPMYVTKADPLNSRIVYAGGGYAGLYKSTNGGDSFNKVLNYPSNAFDIAIDAASTVIYIATNQNGLYRSTNKGGSWTQINVNSVDSILTGYGYSRVVKIDPFNKDTLYVIDDGSLYKSTNAGTDWTVIKANSNSTSVYDVAIDPLTPGTLYITVNGTVEKSTNGGGAWTPILTKSNTALAIKISELDPKIIYVSYRNIGVFQSLDSGGSWNSWNDGLNATNVTSLGQDPIQSQTLFAGVSGDGLYLSKQGGANWTNYGTRGHSSYPSFSDISVDPHFNLLNKKSVFVSDSPDGVSVTTDEGLTWTNQLFTASVAGRTASSRKIVFDKVKSGVIYTAHSERTRPGTGITTYNYIYKSENSGSNWFIVSTGLTTNIIGSSLLIDPINSNNLYVFDRYDPQDGNPITTNLYKTSNSGVSWNNLNIPDFISFLAMNPAKPSELFFANYSNLYKSTSAGSTWSIIADKNSWSNTVRRTPNNRANNLTALEISPFNSNILYAGTSTGIFRSTNGGKDWSPVIVDGMNSNNITSLKVDYINDNIIYVGTNGAGVWKIAFAP